MAKHKSLIAIWILVLVIVGYGIYFVLSLSKDEEPPAPTPQTTESIKATENAPQQAKKGSLGQTLQDGDLAFTVTRTVANGERSVGSNTYARADAEGQFARVSITIKNTGNTTISLPLSLQKADVDTQMGFRRVDEEGTQYAQLDQTKGYWYQNIAPGQTVSGDLLFDMNGGEIIKGMEFHAAENTPGLLIDL